MDWAQSEYASLISQSAYREGVPPDILGALLEVESGLNPQAENFDSNGSVDRGIAQINSQAHPEVSDTQAMSPQYAIPWAAAELAKLHQEYGTWRDALAAYNAGTPTSAAGQSYAAKVLAAAGPGVGASVSSYPNVDLLLLAVGACVVLAAILFA
jgi:soluble lytic murein transglycosylase-like protein